MRKIYVRLEGAVVVLEADRMFTDDIGAGPMLFVYRGEDLQGVFPLHEIKAANYVGVGNNEIR